MIRLALCLSYIAVAEMEMGNWSEEAEEEDQKTEQSSEYFSDPEVKTHTWRVNHTTIVYQYRP